MYGHVINRISINTDAVADFSADYWVLPQLRLLGGVSNITDKRYYSRVFFSGGIEPAPGRSVYAGFAYEF